MSEMVERVAMALELANAEASGLLYPDLMREFARVAIVTMREPTEAMLHAEIEPGVPMKWLDDYSAKRVWQVMIDEALK